MLQKIQLLEQSLLDKSSLDTSQLDRSASVLDSLVGIQAIIEPGSQHVTLISTDGNKPMKMKTKIRIINSDASFLQDNS